MLDGWFYLHTEWEQGFVRSVRQQWDRKQSLSELQLEKLEQVYERTR